MPPISVMIKPVSGLCNMCCKYCFYADELAHRGEGIFSPMDDDTLDKLIRKIFSYAEQFVYLVFQGGEPTLAGAPFYQKVLELERKYNSRSIPVHHAIQTNGLVLTEEMLTVFKEGKFLVGLSVDGTRQIHDAGRKDHTGAGTYDRILENARRLRQAQIDYNILCVVGKTAAQHPVEVFEALAPHGYLQFIPRLEPLDPAERSDDDVLTAADYGYFLKETWNCYAKALRSGNYVSIRGFDNWLNMLWGRPPENCGFAGCCTANYLVESNGNVYPCDFYALDEWLLGNIRETNFRRLALSEKLKAFCDSSRKPARECLVCPYAAICRGGCRRDREPLGEDGVYGKNRLCEGYRFFFEHCLPDMQLLQQQIREGKIRF